MKVTLASTCSSVWTGSVVAFHVGAYQHPSRQRVDVASPFKEGLPFLTVQPLVIDVEGVGVQFGAGGDSGEILTVQYL